MGKGQICWDLKDQLCLEEVRGRQFLVEGTAQAKPRRKKSMAPLGNEAIHLPGILGCREMKREMTLLRGAGSDPTTGLGVWEAQRGPPRGCLLVGARPKAAEVLLPPRQTCLWGR